MKDLGIVSIISHGGPVAVLRRWNNGFVGAYLSGRNDETLLMSFIEYGNRSPIPWPSQYPICQKLIDRIAPLPSSFSFIGNKMSLEVRHDDKIVLRNQCGHWEFENIIKLYKFQILCEHKHTKRYEDDDAQDIICSRCQKCLATMPKATGRNYDTIIECFRTGTVKGLPKA